MQTGMTSLRAWMAICIATILGFSIALPVGTITYFWYEFIISVQTYVKNNPITKPLSLIMYKNTLYTMENKNRYILPTFCARKKAVPYTVNAHLPYDSCQTLASSL